MKILYGITKSNFGGAQRYVFELAREARRLGHQVTVLCGQRGTLVERLEAEKIRVITLEKLERDISLIKEIRSLIEITKILNKEKPDVFHVNSSKMGGLGSLAGRLAKVKMIVFTAHSWTFNEPRSWWQKILIKFFVWLTILLSHKTICVSEKNKKDVADWILMGKKLTVIHNGIQTFGFRERREREVDILTVGAVAELHKIKGIDILLEAWSKFIKRHQGKLLIWGDGEERGNLENMAKKLDIYSSVKFEGFVDNARSRLKDFDIFCMPSRSEGLPYALLEAGLAGLAVIATEVGGIPEIIDSGTTGILIPKDNSETLFSSLLLLAKDRKLRERLGTNLKQVVEKNFSLEIMVRKTLATY